MEGPLNLPWNIENLQQIFWNRGLPPPPPPLLLPYLKMLKICTFGTWGLLYVDQLIMINLTNGKLTRTSIDRWRGAQRPIKQNLVQGLVFATETDTTDTNEGSAKSRKGRYVSVKGWSFASGKACLCCIVREVFGKINWISWLLLLEGN